MTHAALQERSLRKLCTVVLALAALFCASVTSALVTDVTIGERQFEGIPPTGYVVTGAYHPEILKIFASALPAGARLVEVYLPKADFDVLHAGGVPKLDRVYQLLVLTATENKLLSSEGFAEVADAMQKGFAKMPAGTTFAGEQAREPWGLFYGLHFGGDANQGPTEVGAALVVVNYQLMQLMYYVDTNRPNARDEADAGVAAWAKVLRQANPDAQYLAERAGKIDLGGGSSGGGNVAFNIGRLLGLACFFYIVYRLFRRRSS